MSRVKLADVIIRANTKVDKDHTDLKYYVGGEHFESGNVTVEQRGLIEGSTIGPMFYYGFKAGQFLLVSRNPHLKKAGVVDFDGICSEKTFVLQTANPEVLIPEYLPFVLQNDRFWDYAVEHKHGSTNFFINWSTLAEYEFELPSVEEQNRVATLAWAAHRLKKEYHKLIEATDDLVKSQFIEMFGGPESVSGSGVTISDVADVQVGIVIKPTRYYAEGANGIKAFRSLNIGPMSIKDDDWVYFTEEAMKETQRTEAHAGDVLVVRSGNPGTSCVVPPEYDGCNVVDLIIAHPKTSKILPEYLCAFTNMPHGKNQIDSQQRGVAQKHFNVGMYNDLKLILPSIEEQRQFVSFLKQSDKSKFELQQAVEKVDNLIKSLIQQDNN